jgi:hypothetical protein
MQQPQQSVVVGRAKRNIRPLKRLIGECNIAFSLSCAEDVDCTIWPSTYNDTMVSNDHDKMGVCYARRDASHLRRMVHGTLFAYLKKIRPFVANGSSKVRMVHIQVSLQDLRQD